MSNEAQHTEHFHGGQPHLNGCQIQFDSPCTCWEIMEQSLIDKVVSRFLNWQLPKDFSPDCGIKYKNTGYYPSGTNLFNARQAESMIRHILKDSQGFIGSPNEGKHLETIRCMGSVFDDIAAMLNLPKNKYGDPDALMDAIAALQEKVEPVPRVELLAMLKGIWGCGETVACRIMDCLEENNLQVLRETSTHFATVNKKHIAEIVHAAITNDDSYMVAENIAETLIARFPHLIKQDESRG